MSEAINEARRCLNCARPTCRTGCPIANNIPQFIRALSEGNIGLAYETIAERSNLPAICGRVCPHERQCEAHCVLTKNKHGIRTWWHSAVRHPGISSAKRRCPPRDH